jgi:hypothetical protein
VVSATDSHGRILGFLDRLPQYSEHEIISDSVGFWTLFPSSGEGRETPTLLGPLERANLNHWTHAFLSDLPSPVLERLSSSVLEDRSSSELECLPSSVREDLPSSVLERLPSSEMECLPSSVLEDLPSSVLENRSSPLLERLPSCVKPCLTPSPWQGSCPSSGLVCEPSAPEHCVSLDVRCQNVTGVITFSSDRFWCQEMAHNANCTLVISFPSGCGISRSVQISSLCFTSRILCQRLTSFVKPFSLARNIKWERLMDFDVSLPVTCHAVRLKDVGICILCV